MDSSVVRGDAGLVGLDVLREDRVLCVGVGNGGVRRQGRQKEEWMGRSRGKGEKRRSSVEQLAGREKGQTHSGTRG